MYALRMSLRQTQQRLEQTICCKVVAFLDGLEKDDLACITEWIQDRKPAGWISRVVKADGKQLNEKTLKRHLDGQCNCPDETKMKGIYRDLA
jgi:hypothetical protein